MPTKTPSRADDLEVLEMLHLHENEGLTADVVGQRFGRTKSAVLGLKQRTSVEAARVPCLCERPENRDGGMPARWWRS